MNITKRNGQTEPYHVEKISSAIRLAFTSVGSIVSKETLADMTNQLEKTLFLLFENGEEIHIEIIQDLVEKALIEQNYYKEVKSFILYRNEHAKKRQARLSISTYFSSLALLNCLKSIQQHFTEPAYDLDHLHQKFFSFYTETMEEKEKQSILIRAAVELTTQESPQWEFIASQLLMVQFKLQLDSEMKKHNLSGFYEKVCFLDDLGLYGSYILKSYTKDEIDHFETFMVESRNHLLTYSSLDLLLKRYVIKSNRHVLLETPQEMFLGIAMHLALKEKNNRSLWVKKFYDILSQLQVTMATPTLSNARKPFHQMSSCFIDTVDDSLDGIYRSINNFAQVSKYGGGMGLYFGKVRGAGAPIRGFQGAAGGVIRWIKLVNDTAVAVDQLGVRQGAVAVYLDAWHRDLPEFLQLKTNNGDDRMKAHDIFPAICYPDLFWRLAKENLSAMWYLMCPHEIFIKKGYRLEDFYGKEWEKRYLDCVEDNRIAKREIPLKDLVRLILKSAVETGTPFAFNRDHVNEMNPNSHKGMIYCSNLCTEIAQNMSAISLISNEIKTENGDTIVVETTKSGDFVVCNLASLSLGNIDIDDKENLNNIIKTTVRALDNVIDLNFYPLPYAKITNGKYRPIGLGCSGYHHLLAKRGIKWESEEHLSFVDNLFEEINFSAISASCEIAKEKGSYDVFKGSNWQTGTYFLKRNYTTEKWVNLKESVARNGMRNAYLMAIAPTSSTSILAGTTASVDPVMQRYFLEEKKGSILPRVAPNLNSKTFWLYKNAHTIDQSFVVKAAGIRQRHIDQSQSLNLYITNDFTMKQVLNLYIQAWECGVKTIYYVRSKSLEVEECDVCSS